MSRIKVIGNKDALKKFWDDMVEPLEDDQVYVVLGVVRKKYCDNETVVTRSEEALFKHIVADYDFERFYRLLRKCEVDEECYVDRNSGKPIPSSAMAFYIDLTPKSAQKALTGFVKEVLDDFIAVRTDESRLVRLRRMETHIFSHVSKHNARRPGYKVIDVDIKDDIVLGIVLGILNDDGMPIERITETRGGYHIFVPVGGHLKQFYEHGGTRGKLMDLNGEKDKAVVEINKQCQTPIVGTYQGGFLVKELIL